MILLVLLRATYARLRPQTSHYLGRYIWVPTGLRYALRAVVPVFFMILVIFA